MRPCLLFGIIVPALAWAASGRLLAAAEDASFSACSAAQPEARVEAQAGSKSDGAGAKFVAPEGLRRMPAGARFVDVRGQSGKPSWRPEAALSLSFLELRVMAGRARDPIYVFGAGHDDNRIARRIAGWKASESERVRVVRSGAAGLALADSGTIERSELAELLALPPRKVIAVGGRSGGVVAWFGSSDVPASIGARLPGMHDAGLQSTGEIVDWVGDRASEDDSMVVLLGNEPVRLAEAASRASVTLGRPVFYIRGNRSRIERQLDRHAQLVQGRRRIGDLPCG
jgi:hypothetical protein